MIDQTVADVEFVQMLTNPLYLSFLVHERHMLQDERFLAYLAYLQSRFERPEMAMLLKFPNCLPLLAALQDGTFRAALSQNPPAYILQHLHTQQFHQWLHNP